MQKNATKHTNPFSAESRKGHAAYEQNPIWTAGHSATRIGFMIYSLIVYKNTRKRAKMQLRLSFEDMNRRKTA